MASVSLVELQDYFKKFVNAGTYDIGLKHVKLVSIPEAGQLVAEMTVYKDCCNTYGTLHGGFIATAIDVLTSFAMALHPSKPVNGVSVDLNISYLRKADMNDEIVIEARTIQVGSVLGFGEAIITNKQTGDIIAKGQHTRYIAAAPNKHKPGVPLQNGNA